MGVIKKLQIPKKSVEQQILKVVISQISKLHMVLMFTIKAKMKLVTVLKLIRMLVKNVNLKSVMNKHFIVQTDILLCRYERLEQTLWGTWVN